jgi:hypothetical protein
MVLIFKSKPLTLANKKTISLSANLCSKLTYYKEQAGKKFIE